MFKEHAFAAPERHMVDIPMAVVARDARHRDDYWSRDVVWIRSWRTEDRVIKCPVHRRCGKHATVVVLYVPTDAFSIALRTRTGGFYN